MPLVPATCANPFWPASLVTIVRTSTGDLVDCYCAYVNANKGKLTLRMFSAQKWTARFSYVNTVDIYFEKTHSIPQIILNIHGHTQNYYFYGMKYKIVFWLDLCTKCFFPGEPSGFLQYKG